MQVSDVTALKYPRYSINTRPNGRRCESLPPSRHSSSRRIRRRSASPVRYIHLISLPYPYPYHSWIAHFSYPPHTPLHPLSSSRPANISHAQRPPGFPSKTPHTGINSPSRATPHTTPPHPSHPKIRQLIIPLQNRVTHH